MRSSCLISPLIRSATGSKALRAACCGHCLADAVLPVFSSKAARRRAAPWRRLRRLSARRGARPASHVGLRFAAVHVRQGLTAWRGRRTERSSAATPFKGLDFLRHAAHSGPWRLNNPARGRGIGRAAPVEPDDGVRLRICSGVNSWTLREPS